MLRSASATPPRFGAAQFGAIGQCVERRQSRGHLRCDFTDAKCQFIPPLFGGDDDAADRIGFVFSGQDVDVKSIHQQRVHAALRKDQGLSDEPLVDDTDDINAYIDSDSEYDDREPSRVVRIEPKQLRGPLIVILKRVASKHGISERMAKKCWEALQKFEESPEET